MKPGRKNSKLDPRDSYIAALEISQANDRLEIKTLEREVERLSGIIKDLNARILHFKSIASRISQ